MKLPFYSLILGALILLSLPPAAVSAPIHICLIQGTGWSSPYQGRILSVRGVVYADFDQAAQRGFFIQEPGCDGSPATSDGLFVYLAERVEVVQPGDRVEVQGTVEEYYGRTELQAAPTGVVVLSHGNPLPAPVELAPPFQDQAARLYFEGLEGMYVSLAQGRVVGPTDADDRTWLVRDDLGIGRVFPDDPAGTGEILCADDNGAFEITPRAKTADQVLGLAGALDYRLGDFCLELTAEPQVVQGPLAVPLYGPARGLRVATWNLGDLFDSFDDPSTDDSVLSNAEYVRRLQKRALAIEALGEPALLAVQEVENMVVLQTLAARPELRFPYSALLFESIDRRGIDIGLLYRGDQLGLLESQSYQGCTSVVDGLEPDGNGDVENPANAITCDQNGDGILDGNRLFTRPPLAARLQVVAPKELAGRELWVIAVHLKSRLEDTPVHRYTEPRRTAQARFVAGLAGQLRSVYPQALIVVLGDFNDWPDSSALQPLEQAGLSSLFSNLERGSRFTYNYHGLSQVLDNLWVYPGEGVMWAGVGVAHINADYPLDVMKDNLSFYRSSDHDPGWADVLAIAERLYLPLAVK